jgi:hypothetical protein
VAQLSWEYVAGFFDGEGNIYNRLPTRILVSVAQSGNRGKVLLEELQLLLDKEGIRSSLYKMKTHRFGALDCWVVATSYRDGAQRWLELMLPYLRIKKTEAQDTLRYLKIFPFFTSKMKGSLISEGIKRGRANAR